MFQSWWGAQRPSLGILKTMIITAKNLPEQEIKINGDEITVINNVKLDDYMRLNQLKRNCENNGFSADREFRHIGSFPAGALPILSKLYPEISATDTSISKKAIKKMIKENYWMQTVERGI